MTGQVAGDRTEMAPIQVPQGYIPQAAPWRSRLLEMRRHDFPGRLVSFDGIDGSGKSTAIARLTDYISERGHDHIVVKTPTEDVRNSWVWRSFFDPQFIEERSKVDAYAMMILVFGDRLIFQKRVIEPALAEGRWVVCDRYVLSSAAFHADTVHQLLTRALIRPDLSVVMDVDPREAIRRINQREYETLHPEDPGRFATARERLRDLATVNGYALITTTDATADESFARLRTHVDGLLAAVGPAGS